MQPSGYGQGGLDATFAALADPTLDAFLAAVSGGLWAAPVTLVRQSSGNSNSAGACGSWSRGKDAQRRPVKVETKPLVEATAWLETYRQTLERRFERSTCCSRN